MINPSLVFKIASVGAITMILDQVLSASEREDYALLVDLVGTLFALILIIGPLGKLFMTVKTLFKF